MSTDVQLKGDSRRRQLQASKAYAAEHGLDLVENFDLQDIGVSAFTGANLTEGALGTFLEAAEKKKFEAGSYLLVESLDRISRQELRKALPTFLRIIDAGINIVTVADGYVYTAEKCQPIDLIMSIMILARAHEESRIKSQRVGAAWANKRTDASTKKITCISAPR